MKTKEVSNKYNQKSNSYIQSACKCYVNMFRKLKCLKNRSLMDIYFYILLKIFNKSHSIYMHPCFDKFM